MAKKNKRRSFDSAEPPKRSRPEKLIDTNSGVFGFLSDYGVRETIESIIVAVVLALMFRAYEAEAFIIPTGSMAPTLQGQHMDVVCDECGCQYRAGASASASNVDPSNFATVTKTYCPICRYGMVMQQREPDHRSNNGDRILVNKFIYDFQSPERFDVIVFKNPNNGKQNYIKRLIGLPGDRLLIENGDIFNYAADKNGAMKKEIVRKPVDKVETMLQLVDDTNFISRKMRAAGWPSRWSQWSNPNSDWKNNESNGHPYFTINEENQKSSWLRYRHLVPRSAYDELVFANTRRASRTENATISQRPTEWDVIETEELPIRIENKAGEISSGSLIRDYYEYNDRRYRFRQGNAGQFFPGHLSPASHWVGDLAVEIEMEIDSQSGQLILDLVEGGIHFKCAIDIATGEAELSSDGDDGDVVFDTNDGEAPFATTNLKGSGKYKILYVHMDDMLYLWINNRFIDFEGSSYTKRLDQRPVPKYSKTDPRDAEPIGIGVAGASARVNRLKVFRDVFYVAPVNDLGSRINIRNETGLVDYQLIKTYENPENWSKPAGRQIFERQTDRDKIFELAAGQFFPMGDNSPASQDARIWDGPHYVDEEMMIGRAMFIYWPHSLNSPVKYFPNFKRMGFIR